jgi:hypothetical protein
MIGTRIPSPVGAPRTGRPSSRSQSRLRDTRANTSSHLHPEKGRTMSKNFQGAVRVGSGPVHTTESVLQQAPETTIALPIKDLAADGRSIALGYRQEMFSLSDGNKVKGSVSTGAGCGTDAIFLQWGDRQAVLKGRDLLRLWVAPFNPHDAKRMPS